MKFSIILLLKYDLDWLCTVALQGAHSRAYSTAWECVRVIGMIVHDMIRF